MADLLSEPIENLIQDQSCKDFKVPCDVLIVGSGYGGAIAAMRLADQHNNRDVFVFERGKEYTAGDFPESLAEIPRHVQVLRNDRTLPIGYPDGLFDFRIDNPVSVLLGCGLGGGSLINANVAMEPDEKVFDDPAWPSQLSKNKAELQPAFDAVVHLLDAQRYLGKKKYETLKKLGDSLKGSCCELATIAVMQENRLDDGKNKYGVAQNACIGCGNCVTGCNYGSKNTLAMNALPLAKSRGARLFTGVTVLSIEPAGAADGSGGWHVRFRRTAISKTVLHDEVFSLQARVVILAAGTLGSTEILMRSEELGRVRFSDRLGERFSTNGDMLAFGYAQDAEVNAVATEDRSPQYRDIGPTITGYIAAETAAHPDRRRKVTIEDGAIPSALAHVFGEVLATAAAFKRNVKRQLPAWFQKGGDREPLAVHRDALRNSQVLLVMGDDEAPYKLELRRGERDTLADPDDMRIGLGDSPEEPSVFGAANALLERAEKSGGFDAGDYLPNPLWKLFPDRMSKAFPNPGQLISVHPLGGCAMADNVEHGVVNHSGQVFRPDPHNGDSVYRGLYVMDGAIIPCALGVNPFLTIAALAYRNARFVAEDLKWSVQGVQPAELGTKVDGEANAHCEIRQRSERVESTARENVDSGAQSTVTLPGMILAPTVKGKFVEFMTGNLEKVPAWVTARFGDKASALNQRDRLVLEVEITFDDVMGWLTSPSTKRLDAAAAMSVNLGPTHPVQDEHLDPLIKGKGEVMLLNSDRPCSWTKLVRTFCAILAFITRRGLSDAAGAVDWWNPFEVFQAITGFVRVAWNHANWRYLTYSFTFPSENGNLILNGRKELAYAPGKRDPWTGLAELPFTLSGSGEPVEGLLCVDLVRLTQRAPFQVLTSRDTPTTLAAMVSAGMMFFRVIFQTHFWSFGAPDYPDKSPIGNRHPGPLRLNAWTTIDPEHRFFEVQGSSRANAEQLRLRLVRYQPAKIENGSILIVHGLATSSLAFATDTVDVSMAKYFCQHGYDVWLLDYRLSISLPYAARQWTMDQIAHHDMPAAVKYVYEQTGGPIQVFAHCIGAGSLAMAILKGRCHDERNNRSMISALVTHAVHPWMVPSAANHLKINLASFFRDSITQPTYDSVLPVDAAKTAVDVMLDRIAGSLPWPLRHDKQQDEAEVAFHQSETDDRKGKESCNRLSLFYGFEWWHKNLSEETHKRIADLLGTVNLETVRQIYFILFRRRLTTRSGANSYVKARNFERYWKFPTLFAHGHDSQLYDPTSAVSSCLRLRSLREQAGQPNGPTFDAYWFEVPDCGHMDLLFGKDAATKVYPTLDAFFRQALRKPIPKDLRTTWNTTLKTSIELTPDPFWESDARPECGPVIGWTRREGNVIALRVWVEPYLFSALEPQGNTSGNINSIVSVPLPELPRHPPADPDDEGTIADYPGTYWVYDISLPEDFDQDIQISINYSDQRDIRFHAEKVPPLKSSGHEAERRDAMEGVRIPLSRLPWFGRLRKNSEKESDHGAFLVGSCRYPGSPFDEDLADRIFAAMLQHVDDSAKVPGTTFRNGIDHVLLVGDQIYADATADIFDTRELRERFTTRYREAFGASSSSGRKHRNLRKLLANVPTYMAVDDHEFDDNWPGNAEVLFKQTDDPVVRGYVENFRHGLAAAKAYQWSMSHRDGQANGWSPSRHDQGLWHTFESGGLPFFVMDTRTERTLRQENVSWGAAHIVGERQFDRLTKWLSKEPADKPKFIVSGSVLAPVARKFTKQQWLYRINDDWAGYPDTWRSLVKHIVEEQIQKVVFISGDYHFSAVAKLTLNSKSNSGEKPPVIAYSIVASGLFAPLPFANSKDEEYDWGTPLAGQPPNSVPYELPFSDEQAGIEVEPYLLCIEPSHFLRVDAHHTHASNWQIGVSACNRTGIIAPPMLVKPPFQKGLDDVVRWDRWSVDECNALKEQVSKHEAAYQEDL